MWSQKKVQDLLSVVDWTSIWHNLEGNITIQLGENHCSALRSLSGDMRRDRLLVAVTLVTLLAADVHFVLIPRLKTWYHLSRESCACRGFNVSLGNRVPKTDLWLLNQSSTLVSAEQDSKLERLFRHSLYNIRLPELGPDDMLLQHEELMNYYQRKVTRWER